MSEVLTGSPLRGTSRRLRWIHLVPVLALFALGAWVFASPVGASPDDDYHLASVWCANGARADLCAPDEVHGENWRLVLPGIKSSPCFVADVEASAGCQKWPSAAEPTVAASHGNWNGANPQAFYAFMNVFASHDIQASALGMRFVNAVAFLALTTALAWLLPARLGVPLIAGWMITAVPLGSYLIASNNPGAWAVIGVGGGWFAAMGWFSTEGRRFWALGTLTAVFVVMAAGSRTDAAVYSILGLGIASVLSFERSRAFALKLLLPAGLAVIAMAFFFASGYSSVAGGGLTGGIPDSASRNPAAILAFNLISMPQLWTGVFGSWGLGWRMESWPGFPMVEFATLAVFLGLASLGLRFMPARKAIMVLALVATLYILPLYVLTVGLSVVSENVQPRYILPLVVVLGGLLLLTPQARQLRPGPWHVIPAIVLLTVANSIALYTNLRRYLTGFDVQSLNLDVGAEWWWAGFPIGPMMLWALGSAAFAAAAAILGIAWLRDSRESKVSV